MSRALPVVRGQTSFSYEHSDSETSTLGTPQGENFQTMLCHLFDEPAPPAANGFRAAYSSNYGAQLLTELLNSTSGYDTGADFHRRAATRTTTPVPPIRYAKAFTSCRPHSRRTRTSQEKNSSQLTR